MEKESFEDSEVARMLNDAFVCIKVDREERPDLDAAYMKVCQAMTGTGGWPLHIIMTDDKKPFFAATYIPKENRFGQLGMKQLVPQIKQLWMSKRNELIDSAEKIRALLKGRENESSLQPTEELAESTLDEACLHFAENFDERNGGFGTAPKFPSPHNLSFLLRYWKRTRHDKALQMVEKTLDAMRLGGIYDHLGFGFHRYSTDAKWLVPHFEKMLYDQAMLVTAYTEAYQVTRKEDYRQTVREIISYVLRNMAHPSGGFYSAEDADSEGEEGKFYLWTEREIRQVLSEEEAGLVKKVFGTEEEGNFEATTGKKTGKNVLHLRKPPAEIAMDLHFSPEKLQKLIEEARQKLLAARQKRVHPSIDDKILTDWNGLMIVALAKASQVFDEPEYSAAARKAADFIIRNLFDAEGKFLHRYREGEASIDGFLDDYAFFTWGLVELYEAVFETKYLRYAIDLTDKMLKHFWDKEHGGFYQTADYSEAAFLRSKGIYDGAYPSGNSAAALDLICLARMTGETRFEEKAAQLMRAFSREVTKDPSAHTQLMSALDFALGPSSEVVVVGDPRKEDAARMLKTLWSKFLPRKVVILRSTAEKSQEITDIAKFTENLHGEGDKATAFVCRGHVCNLPTTDVRAMLELLNGQ
jgi:hypothetical protein